MNLIDDMMKSLPIYAYPTQQMLKSAGKFNLSVKSKLEITSVMDAGHAGGIMCGIKIGDEVLLISLTHLELKDEHHLKEKINAYKRDRINLLKAESYARDESIGRNRTMSLWEW